MSETGVVKGYKVFNSDWTCSPRGNTKQYTCPGKFEEDITPIQCMQGMHFCKKAADCFSYYGFNPKNKVAEVIAYGDISEGENKCCTNKLEIVREIAWAELLELVNSGKACTGLCNGGDYNSGNHNGGDYNSGDYNSGNRNGGDYNGGDYNSGNRNGGNHNSGDCNSGNRNGGDYNSGNRNGGNHNSGDCNSGDRNSGNRNSGDWNSGDYNSGDWNSGDYNSGDYNSGDWNSGDYNSGDYNSGDWNKASQTMGCFNTKSQKLRFFDEEADMTITQWRDSDACRLLGQIDFSPVDWIQSGNMTDEEKAAHPEHETTGGYLKVRDNTDCCVKWWKGLSESDRNIIRSIPNFDTEKFYQITGISTVEA